MSDLQIFDFNSNAVRVITLQDEPWFVAADVALILGYSSTKDATRVLDDDEKGGHILPTPGGAQEFTIINESGLYGLVLRSRRPEAKAFRRWITGEVIPQIMRTGHYAAPAALSLPSYPEALRQLAATLEEKERLEAERALDAPKVEAYEALIETTSLYLVREAAKMLGLGQNRLYDFMRKQAIVFPNGTEPYQRHVDAGRFVVKVKTYMRGKEPASSKTTYVTGKGLNYLRKRLVEAGVISLALPQAGD